MTVVESSIMEEGEVDALGHRLVPGVIELSEQRFAALVASMPHFARDHRPTTDGFSRSSVRFTRSLPLAFRGPIPGLRTTVRTQ